MRARPSPLACLVVPAIVLSTAACGSSSTDQGIVPLGDSAGDDTLLADDTGATDDTGTPPDDSGSDSVAPPTDTGPDPTDRSKCAADPDKAGLTTRTVKAGGSTMKYLGYAPAGYDPKTATSLVVALHGAGDTAGNYFAAIWKSNADSKKFLVVTPEASSALGSGFTWTGADADMILAAMEDFGKCYSVNPKRRILNGFSAGGIMAYLIGLQVAPDFAGISVASANLGSAEAYAGIKLLPAPWLIPVSHFHGTTDTNFPIATARAGRDKLIAAGHKVYWHEFDGGHTTNAGFAGTMYDDLASSTAP